MEPTLNPSTDSRYTTLKNWLVSIAHIGQLDVTTLEPASSDASFRQYYRLSTANGTAIVMDAPPQHEDCRPFVHVTGLLAQTGVVVPTILAQDIEQGFLLLSDLGRQTYFQAIQEGVDDARLQRLYRGAIASLVSMQQGSTQGLPSFDTTRLGEELGIFTQWYAHTHCQAVLTESEHDTLKNAFATLVHDNAGQPSVLVHRDYHSPNLMVGADDGQPGIIDYQDAVVGPLSYDIASLVMDARTTWEEAQQLDWAIRYWEAARAAGLPVPSDFADFHRAYEWMGLQRNLRILGVFARLSHRDNKHHYLDHIPRVNAYVRQVASRYGVFRPMLCILDRLDNVQVTSGYTF